MKAMKNGYYHETENLDLSTWPNSTDAGTDNAPHRNISSFMNGWTLSASGDDRNGQQYETVYTL